jgi:hypothetical protein
MGTVAMVRSGLHGAKCPRKRVTFDGMERAAEAWSFRVGRRGKKGVPCCEMMKFKWPLLPIPR